LLGAALGATLVLPAWAALPIFGGLGLGLALPFLAIGFVPALRRRLPKPGPWMATFRKWMALPMGLTAIGLSWLLWRQTGPIVHGWMLVSLIIILIGHLIYEWRKGSRPSGGLLILAVLFLITVSKDAWEEFQKPAIATDAETPETFSPAALAKARATGKPVFVYFTADWCLSCKANEAGAIDRDAVKEAFDAAGVITLVGDWTNGDPVITRTLAAHGRNSVPLYLWYAPGATAPVILPQILTPGTLTGLVDD
jgi:thiol:disulfide interchange protein